VFEGGSRIIFSINNKKEKEWFHYLNKIQKNLKPSVYIKKIGYVSGENLNISIQDKNICNLRVEELTEKFNNSISGYL
jgi:phosphoribosylformylglycinamidine synthase